MPSCYHHSAESSAVQSHVLFPLFLHSLLFLISPLFFHFFLLFLLSLFLCLLILLLFLFLLLLFFSSFPFSPPTVPHFLAIPIFPFLLFGTIHVFLIPCSSLFISSSSTPSIPSTSSAISSYSSSSSSSYFPLFPPPPPLPFPHPLGTPSSSCLSAFSYKMFLIAPALPPRIHICYPTPSM